VRNLQQTAQASDTETFTEAHISRLRAAFERELSCREREVDGSPAIAFTEGGKTVEFMWPRNEREELWVALMSSEQDYLDLEADLVMWEEPSTAEGCEWIVDFFEQLGWRYLRWPTRIARSPPLVGPKRLECFDGEAWRDIYTEFGDMPRGMQMPGKGPG